MQGHRLVPRIPGRARPAGDGARLRGGTIVRRIDLPTLRAAWWTLRAARRARRQLRREQIDVAMRRLPAVPNVPDHAERGVLGVLGRRADTCLVRAMVRQAWYAAHGRRLELVIGVSAPGPGFQAHAWLDGDGLPAGRRFTELTRRPAP